MTPIMVLGKVRRPLTWETFSGFEVFAYALILAFTYPRDIMPKINEGYIYAYTLLHWYFLADTINDNGFNWVLLSVVISSVYPSFLIVKNVFLHKKLARADKTILFYWFIFCVLFVYIDQFVLEIIKPILTMDEIGLYSCLIILFSALQVYFLTIIMSLMLLGVTLMHLDNNNAPFKERWKNAVLQRKRFLRYKLAYYVEYQVSVPEVLLITIISAVLFYLDTVFDMRAELIVFYTIIFPIVFFYLRLTPSANLRKDT